MSRIILEASGLDDLPAAVNAPTRFVFPSPRRGGPRLATIRAALIKKGRVRFSGTPARIFADVDPGEAESPVVTLDMIVRDDAEGLERAILSSLAYVDAIVIGVDGRSSKAPREVAKAYADVVHVFQAADIELTDEEWAVDKIHFGNARNVGRAKVSTPWTFVLDSDEYIRRARDFREMLRAAPAEVGAYSMSVLVDDAVTEDTQRLARTQYRWCLPTHNQLAITGARAFDTQIECVHDINLRTAAEAERRTQQRENGIEGLRAAAEAGQISPLFHLARHLIWAGDPEGFRLAEDYRLRTEPHGPCTNDRVWLAMDAAFRLYQDDEFMDAERWALRVLFDGPRVEAFCLLGDLAEDVGDLERALAWYEIACVTPDTGQTRWQHYSARREGRRDGLKIALGKMSMPMPASSTPPHAVAQ